MAKQENVYWPSDEETNIHPVEIVDEVNKVCFSILCRFWWAELSPMCVSV